MDLQQIKELALLMQRTGLTSLHLTEGAVNIQMERAGTGTAAAVSVCAADVPTGSSDNGKAAGKMRRTGDGGGPPRLADAYLHRSATPNLMENPATEQEKREPFGSLFSVLIGKESFSQQAGG